MFPLTDCVDGLSKRMAKNQILEAENWVQYDEGAASSLHSCACV